MSAVSDNVNAETKASDMPEMKADDNLESKTTEKPVEILETENVSCCGSCS